MSKEHIYAARLLWEGSGGTGTINHEDYGRRLTLTVGTDFAARLYWQADEA